MGGEFDLSRARARLADVLKKYADSHGLGSWSKDYWTFMRTNEEWGRVHAVLVAKAFEGRDEFACYSDVMAFLRQELKDEPALFEAVDLVVKVPAEVGHGGIFGIGPEYTEQPVPQA